MIEQGVKDVYDSQNYQDYLRFLSKFHNYSLNNTILILMQRPDASFVAGYQAWKTRFNRQVNKGEKGIQILAPYEIKVDQMVDRFDEQGNKLFDVNGNPLKESRKISVRRFRMVTVFDISQTDGQPVPSLMQELKGSSNNAKALIKTIQEISAIPIEFKTSENDEILQSGAKGYYSHTYDMIVVNDELEDIHKAKTLVHEYCHSLLHKDSDKSHEQKEIEAESLAFVICDHFGIDTSEYSFSYVAAYSGNNAQLLKDTLGNIQKFSHDLISKLEQNFEQNLSRVEIEGRYYSPVDMERLAGPFIQEMRALYTPGQDTQKWFNQLYKEHYSKYPEVFDLMDTNSYFRITLGRIFEQNVPVESQMFITHSIERHNYAMLLEYARPIIQGDAYYMKLTSKGKMDLDIDRSDSNEIYMSHFAFLNGDMMADPSLTISLDRYNQLAIVTSYQQDFTGTYLHTDNNPDRANDMNWFLTEWFQNLNYDRYRIDTIQTDDKEYSFQKDLGELKKYCKELGIDHMAKNEITKEEQR